MHTFTATFGTKTFSRTTEHRYPYASFVRGEVRFHKTYEAAKRRAGKYAPVVKTEGGPRR